ncbi:MAG TPA: DNA-binding transcriptional regulator [Thermoguttaceae bacterium]|nr:DNA-binding transcriptional regulator [Thermoguttaceae bacterium]
MKEQKAIAFVGPLSIPHRERMFRGIVDFAKSHANWRFFFDPELHSISLASLEHCRVDGAFIFWSTPKDTEVARRMGIPVVNFSSEVERTGLPTVLADSRAMGRLAAEHLLDRGFKNLAFFGRRGAWYSKLRAQGFEETVLAAGKSCHLFEDAPLSRHRTDDLRKWMDEVESRLRKLPLPLGLFVVHDHRARIVTELCHLAGLRVPDDVAIVGANDDTIVCELCQPSLSSVANNGWEVGYRAAQEMYRQFQGERPATETIFVQPGAVVPRDSTNTIVIDNPEVRAAAQFIRRRIENHPTAPLSIEDVLATVAVSRRWLEQRFPEALGCSIKQYIDEARVRLAKQLLSRTSGPKPRLYEIAEKCGFENHQRFRAVFERLVGMTPAQYRGTMASRSDDSKPPLHQ